MSGNRLCIPLELRYKGARRYLQGGDIYHAMVSAFSEASGLKDYAGEVVFHRFATRQCDMYAVQGDEQTEMPAGRVCDGNFHTIDGDWNVWLVETDRPVTDSYDFDEEAICAASAVNEKSIKAGDSQGASPIEAAVALTKHLHNRLFPLTDQRWIFTKFEFLRILQPDDSARLSITLLMNLHNRITKSELRSGEQSVGHIYFSAVTK